MNYIVKHEIKGRIRLACKPGGFSIREADILCLYMLQNSKVTRVKTYERTGDMVVYFTGDRKDVLEQVKNYHYETARNAIAIPENTGRELNRHYQEKLINKVLYRVVGGLFIPPAIRNIMVMLRAVKYVYRGLRSLRKGRLEVAVLDATAIAVSIIRQEYSTAGSVMFLLGIGELLEEWTHKKSIDDLARSMALNIDRVWILQGETEIQIPISELKEKDQVVVHMGTVIPIDGKVLAGEAMVNQASLTGESIPAKKEAGAYVYAGTAVEEGELIVEAKNDSGNTRYEKIVTMIENSEKLKSEVESKAEHVADSLVPYSFAGTALTWALTRNAAKAISILMVDFSCALKLAMPLAVLSAMRECSQHHLLVKGGKFMEAVAEADTIVFDKTGTLTKAEPAVVDIITFENWERDETLRISACLEEHFPHSIANAVVRQAESEGLTHHEMHSKVEYVVAHGIASEVDGRRVLIGSRHFIFEDENITIPEEEHDKLERLPEQYSHLYLAIGGRLAAVLCISDPVREEAKSVISQLRNLGFSNIVMMTGDNERTAKGIARETGIDRYFAEVLPEDKAGFIEQEKAKGHKVVMIGDGINDSPALSAADVGIAMNGSAQIAKEIADITIMSESLDSLVVLKQISNGLMKRIHSNYRFVVGFNLGLIGLGVSGVILPNTSALLHNTSTTGISLKSMTNILPET